MKKIIILLLFCTSFFIFAAEKAPLVKMAVFPDNTVFSVRRAEIPANKDTLSFFDDTQFLKGSFCIWSKEVNFGIRYMPEKRFNSNIYTNLNNAFANQNVVVTLKNFAKNERIVSGRLVKIENPENPYEIPNIIAIEDNASKKITYIKVHDIESISADKADFMNDIYSAPCWTFSRKKNTKALPFEFSYLTQNIAFQSTVELHLNSKDKMDIIHNAAIRNNGKKFDCPDFYLVSGSPEISTKNIFSLLCMNTVSPRRNYNYAAAAERKSKANFMMDGAAQSSADFIQQSGDILYRSLGQISMAENESRLVKLQSASNVPYRTIVKWEIPAARNAYGRIINNNDRQTAFNSLIFKNLCPSMLDKAPVAIYADRKLMMLTNLDSNTPSGAERSIRLSNADGIECRIEEKEIVGNRVQNVVFNNRRYVKCTIEATLKITSFRKTAAPVKIDYNFSGELVKSEGAKGKAIQTFSTSQLLNPNGRTSFEFELKAGETKEIKIISTVLTDR